MRWCLWNSFANDGYITCFGRESLICFQNSTTGDIEVAQLSGSECGSWGQPAWVWIPASPFPSCVTRSHYLIALLRGSLLCGGNIIIECTSWGFMRIGRIRHTEPCLAQSMRYEYQLNVKKKKSVLRGSREFEQLLGCDVRFFRVFTGTNLSNHILVLPCFCAPSFILS